MGSLGVRIDVYGSTDQSPPVPCGAIVRVRGREKHLVMSETGLTLSSCSSSCSDITEQSIPWRDVIGCETDQTSGKEGRSGHADYEHSDTATFVVHYIQHKVKDKTLRPEKLKIRANSEHVTGWLGIIQKHCANVPGRPRKVCTVINPISGNHDGPKFYRKTMTPLFELANIMSDVVTTDRKQAAVEIADNLDLAKYDALVLIGGDGLYNEVVEGLTRQAQRRSGVDINDAEARFAPIDIPLALIPSGTGNAVSRWANGITDLYTAVLNIFRGQQQRAQLSSVHCDGRFLRMSGVNVVYGMMSDMIKRTEELRWMKTKRYPYAMMAMVMGRKRMFNLQLQYKTTRETRHNSKETTRSNVRFSSKELTISAEPSSNNVRQDDRHDNTSTSVDNESTVTAEPTVNTEGQWVTYDPQGRRFRCMLSFSCALDRTAAAAGAEESTQYLTGNHTDLIIDHGCFTPKLLKYLLNYVSPVKSENTTSKICVLQNVTAYRMVLRENEEVQSSQCCAPSPSKDRALERIAAMDGEVIPLTKPMIDVRIRESFISLYGCVEQGLQDTSEMGGLKNKAFEPAADITAMEL